VTISRRLAAIALAVTLSGVVSVVPASAQNPDPPESPPVQLGPVVLAPVLRLSDFGYDSNILNRAEADNPESDITAVFIPSLEGWLRMAHLRVTGRGQFDMHYFKTRNDLNAVDTDVAGRIDLPINRLTPYVTGTLIDARYRPSLEIDSLSRRRTASVTAGLDLRLTPKLVANVNAHAARLEYDANSLYLGSDLADELNHDGRGEGVQLRMALTPYTTVGAYLDRNRDRFDTSPERDADSSQIGTFVEFNPAALISGRASIAFLNSQFRSGTVPDFNGTIMQADLTYTMRARTQILVGARRQLNYSYIPGQQQYVEAGFSTKLTQRIGEAWDVGFQVGWGHLSYLEGTAAPPILPDGGGTTPPPTPASTSKPPGETTWNAAIDLGYNLRRTRLGFHFDNLDRASDENTAASAVRATVRTRIGSTISYTF